MTPKLAMTLLTSYLSCEQERTDELMERQTGGLVYGVSFIFRCH